MSSPAVDRNIWAWAIRLAINEGRPERLMQLIVAKEIPDKYRADVAGLVALGATHGIKGNAKKKKTDSSSRSAIYACYLMYTADNAMSPAEAIGTLADDTGLSESTIVRAIEESKE